MKYFIFLLTSALASIVSSAVVVQFPERDVTYSGFERNDIEIFLNIPYAHNTGGANRFKPPRALVPAIGTKYDNTKQGPACPQSLGQRNFPLQQLNVTKISEDCLNLNVARPKLNTTGKLLPVMLWVHGGGFFRGGNMEPTTQPDGLVLESVKNGLPVIHVAINYRLGLFGFAQSDVLRKERSENAGLRDQRLAIEWVRDNIHHFGGDGGRITIFGHSSGGLAVGMQLLAYGGAKPLPFQRGIAESQVLEPGITGNFTIDAFTAVADYLGCNTSSIHAPETLSCLRTLDTETLLNASLEVYIGDIEHNNGDIWLPSVDGDFLPSHPSTLIREGSFGKATMMMGWMDGDVNLYTDFKITTASDTAAFISSYLTSVDPDLVKGLLGMYPISDFPPPTDTVLTAEFYRAARIFRDILMVCEPFLVAEAMHKKGIDTYLFDFNQTLLEPIVESLFNISKLGVIHSSEFAYTFGNLSHYHARGLPFNPSLSDYALARRASRTWSTFASKGKPSLEEKGTLQGWRTTFGEGEDVGVFVVGGPKEGFTKIDGKGSHEAIKKQKLRERCAFINREEFVKGLQY